jgi:hypothetical protein
LAMVLVSCNGKGKQVELNKATDGKTPTLVTRDEKSSPLIEISLDSLLMFRSMQELKKIFGENVISSRGDYPEGMGTYRNTLLFPKSKNQVEFVWQDTVNYSKLIRIQLYGDSTVWKTKEGLTVNTSLKELEKLNRKPFIFLGFGWDYGGQVNWDGGAMEERKIQVYLRSPSVMSQSEQDQLLGDDKELRSDSDLAQKVNPVVGLIIMYAN